MKRFVTFLLLAVILLSALTFPVLANSAPSLENGEAVVSAGSVVIVLFLAAISVTLSVVTTCLVEWFIWKRFGWGDVYNKLIIRTNLVSQLIMWAVFFAALVLGGVAMIQILLFRYWLFLICLEIPIYVGEFIVYRRKMPEIPWKVCLLYTVTANTASLILGQIVNRIII